MRAAPVPNSAWRLIVLEFWERFSYYGILAILVLFLTSPEAAGGFGWSDSRALDLLATFTALAFMLPTLGGYVADRWIGPRMSVLVGSWLLVLGNVSITLAALHSKLPSLAADRAAGEGALFGGMMLVALGNGFFKSSLITLLGGLFSEDGVARDRAFRRYYQAIMLGALAASLCVGAMAQAAGWWSGFALTALGMAISLLIFLRLASPELRASMQCATAHPATVATRGDEPVTASAISIGVLCAFLPLITVAWVQLQGLWLLEVERWCDRTIGSFTVPSAWLLAVNAIVIVMLAPIAGRMWQRLGRPGQAPGFAAQFVTAFFIMGLAHLLIAVGFSDPKPGAVSLLWPVGCVLIITVAEAIFWPSSYNALHRLAPIRLRSMLMGLWLAMLGLGQYFAHQVARSAEVIGFPSLSISIGVAMLVGGVALALCARRLPALALREGPCLPKT
ncbi:MAG TPA: hypothetical protein VJ011_08120 [Steroidobacteraceae bacterium]|nr:hypothetical protein [Steroidobacteraceae bacterium]